MAYGFRRVLRLRKHTNRVKENPRNFAEMNSRHQQEQKSTQTKPCVSLRHFDTSPLVSTQGQVTIPQHSCFLGEHIIRQGTSSYKGNPFLGTDFIH